MRAWLFRIARNDLIDHQRLLKPVTSLDAVNQQGTPMLHVADPGRGPEDTALHNESERELQHLLRQLPDS